jgi:hypothetical protein
MANLIPAAGKHQIVWEYRTRVAVVWMMIFGFACTVVAILMVPTYVLVDAQYRAMNDRLAAANSQEKFEAIKGELDAARELAKYIQATHSEYSFTAYIEDLEALIEGVAVELDKYQFASVVEKKSSRIVLTVAGTAESREELAKFKDAAAQLSWVEAAELPLSSLAGGEDVPFTMQLTLSTSN